MSELKQEVTTKQLEKFYQLIRGLNDGESKISRIEVAASQLRCAKEAGFFDGDVDVDAMPPKQTYKLALRLGELIREWNTIDPE